MIARKPLNPWLIFALICVPIFIGSVDLTAIVVVLPQATLDLLGAAGVNKADQALWAVTGYLLAYTISLALLGRFSDALSRKKLFLVCVAIFIAGSLWASFAGDFPLAALRALPIWPDRTLLPLISLIIARVVQAIGAGGSVSVGMALVSDIFPNNRRAGPISLIAAIDSLGWVVGNLYSGLMLQVLPSWQWLYLINAIVAALALLLVWLALRRIRSVATGTSFDLRGAVVFAAGMITLTLTLKSLKSPSLATFLLACSSIALIASFFWLQMHTRNALFNMKFIRQREILQALFTNLVVGFGLMLMVAGVPLFINLRTVFLRGEGLLSGALRAGAMLSALSLTLIVAAVVSDRLYRKIGQVIPVALGLTLTMLGFIGASLWTYTSPSYAIALPLAFVGAGLGLSMGPLSLVVVNSAEASSRGLASSLVLMMRLFGMTLGAPLAATLTLGLANQWAMDRTAQMGVFHDIANAMLIPPLATDALARVMLAGVFLFSVTLALFYIPQLRRAFQSGIKPTALFFSLTAVFAMVVLVGVVSSADSAISPTIPTDSVAQQLPATVTFYAALNLQQIFLEHTERPLNALTGMGNKSTPAPQNAPVESSRSALDSIIEALFNPKQWNAESYGSFCHNQELPSQWQTCFNNGLLSWTGPQMAVALLPGKSGHQDYVILMQATNRNNAIGFLTDLASALGISGMTQVKPGLNNLILNANTPNEQKLAVTQSYVILGSPGGVQAILDGNENTLANDPDFLAMNSRLPMSGFLKVFSRSNTLDARLKPVIGELFQSQSLNMAVDTAIQGLSLFTSVSSAPPMLGLSLRLDEQQLTADMVSSLRSDISSYTTATVPDEVLALVPASSGLWAAAQINMPAAVDKIDISTLLTQFVPADVGGLGQEVIDSLGQSVQTLLGHAKGSLVVSELPLSRGIGSKNTKSPSRQYGLILPLNEQDHIQIVEALTGLEAKLKALAALSGLIEVSTTPANSETGETVSVKGKALQAALPDGIQYTMTSNHMLLLTVGTNVAALLGTLQITNDRQHYAAQEIATILPGPSDRFFYAYADPSDPATQATRLVAAISGQIKDETLRLHLVLRSVAP